MCFYHGCALGWWWSPRVMCSTVHTYHFGIILRIITFSGFWYQIVQTNEFSRDRSDKLWIGLLNLEKKYHVLVTQGSPATVPTSCWLWTKHLHTDIWPLSEKTQGREVLVWAVNKMEQSKAALCPVPNLHLTWISRFLIWLFPLAQLLLAGTELQNEMKITWLHFRMSVSRLLQMQWKYPLQRSPIYRSKKCNK